MLYEIRDPIHTTITFNDKEKKVIDHPFVQKLRFIRQLGLKSLVYPGAVHNRFEHCLGAMHMAGRLFDAIDGKSDVFKKFGPENKKYFRELLRLAGLLHDVGHGPFSHASEHLLPNLGQLDIPKSWYTKYNPRNRASHEDYSVLLTKTLGSEKENIFGADEARDVASFIHKKVTPSASWDKRFKNKKEAAAYHQFMRSLISGEIDVDRMDYLLRDAYFTGVPYGNYDLEWLLHVVGAIETKDGPQLVIKLGGIRAFEDFLLARYHMVLQVYFHRTTAVFEMCIEKAFQTGELDVKISADPYEYADVRDSTVYESLFRAAKDENNFWSRQVVNRLPLKSVYQAELGRPEHRARYQAIVRELKKAGLEYFEITAQRTMSEQGLKPGSLRILVAEKFLDRVEYTPIEKRSELLKKYNNQINRIYVYCRRDDYKKVVKILSVVK